MDATETQPQKRRRTERGGRSRNGCQTCLSKRVKCDEQRPRCKRCVRLELTCEWQPPRQSLAQRRRGTGPIKDRGDWKPQDIRPKRAENAVSGEDTASSPGHGTPSSSSTQLDCDIAPGLYDQALGISVADTGTLISGVSESQTTYPTNWMMLDGTNPSQQQSAQFDNFLANPHFDLSRYMPFDFFTIIPGSYINALEPAPSIGTNDTQAVAFHRMVLAPLKSTRGSNRSAHTLFFNLAALNRMALHFLLAFSHSELAIHQGFSAHPPMESYLHFQRGSQLFNQALESPASTSHIAMMLSFLYLYMFWMRRDPLDVQRLRELSSAVLIYVKRHALDEMCAYGTPNAGLSSLNVALLSRMLTYIYDRDVFCGFFGCGETFAGYVSENPEARRNIWQRSRSAIPSPDTGTAVPLPPEDQYGSIIGVYFTLIMLQHDINWYSQGSDAQTLGMELGIWRKLQRLREEQSFLFDLAATCGQPGQPSPPLMALVTVTVYHALEIYLYRSRGSNLGELPVPAQVHCALAQLITAAYHATATGPVQLLERFQWALLVAGIETHDPVYREWIMKNLSDPAMRGVFEVVEAAKGMSGISMRAIRQLVGDRA
ncbi:hypothetical protein ACJZ2D_000725 [Fusarium nematophilum]